MHGVMFADGTLLPGSCATNGDDLEIVISTEDALQYMRKLMDPEITKTITFYVNVPVVTYEGYTKFLYMQPDRIDGKMDFWLTKE